MKVIYDARYRKPGKTIGEIVKDDIVYDYNFCENELVIEIGEKVYRGMRVLMLRECEVEK